MVLVGSSAVVLEVEAGSVLVGVVVSLEVPPVVPPVVGVVVGVPVVGVVVVSPELELATRAARAVLPGEVPLPLAVAHAQNLAALVHALHVDDRGLLAASLRDLLAEPYRAPLVPGFAEVQAAALTAGALGCSLSGAGPAVFAVAAVADAERVAAAAVAAWRAAGVDCRARVCAVDRRGARRLERAPWS